jgi:type II secretory pathway pseudopilin PulG
MDRKKSNAGFSLIEMSFIIIIFGLIVGTIVPLLVSKIQQDKVREARDIVRMVRDEVIGYYYAENCTFPTDLSNATLRRDPWGNSLGYDHNATIVINSNTIQQVFFVVSSGKNLRFDYDYNNATQEYSFSNYGEPSFMSNDRIFDDIFEYVKNSTLPTCP